MTTISTQNVPAANKYQNTRDKDKAIQTFENSLASPLQLKGISDKRFNLVEQMKKYNIPGVSVALIDQGQIVWTKTWGVADTNDQTPLNDDSLFQAASTSKQVAALAALQLVEKGDLSLDSPINNYLTRWQLPDNELTQQQPVTLTHLLSHTAATTVHGFRGYAQSEHMATALEVLNGDEVANSDPVIVDTLPGTAFRYSGGGCTVYQVAMEDVTQSSFVELLDKNVLTPAGMTNSTFQHPLPEARCDNVATGHYVDGQAVVGKYHNYDTLAAAGLWTTPTDLAKFSLAVIQSSQGASGALLSKEMCSQYLTPHKANWGLGPRLFIQDDKVIGFHHGGANEGFRGNSVALLDGRGAVVMTNGEQGDSLVGEILAAAAEVYDWPVHKANEQTWLALSDDELERLSGTFTLTAEGETHQVTVKPENRGLRVDFQWLYFPHPFYLTQREEGVHSCIDPNGMPLSFSENDQKRPVITIMGNVFTKG